MESISPNRKIQDKHMKGSRLGGNLLKLFIWNNFATAPTRILPRVSSQTSRIFCSIKFYEIGSKVATFNRHFNQCWIKNNIRELGLSGRQEQEDREGRGSSTFGSGGTYASLWCKLKWRRSRTGRRNFFGHCSHWKKKLLWHWQKT